MIVGLLTAAGLSKRLAGILAPILTIGVVLLLLWALWARGERLEEQRDEARNELALADARIVLLEADAALKETAAEERQADTAATVKMEKELVDAIATVPDTQPDAVRIALGCQRLRRAGRLSADLPVVCRPGTGT